MTLDRRAFLAVLAGGATLLLPRRAAAGLADRIGATFGLMANDFIKAAQPVEGLVVSVEGDIIYIDIGARKGAQIGQEMTVFRKGDPFYHQVTGKLLGRYEDVLGYAQLRRVEPEFSAALFIPLADAAGPRPEDGVRISRGRIRLAVTPVLDLTSTHADVRRVPFMFASILERSKRFQVFDPLAVSDMFANGTARVEEVLGRPERAVRIAKNLEVTGWLVPVLLERRGTLYLDATWVSAVTGTPLISRRQPLLTSGSSEGQRFPWEPRPED